jgi:putative sterol carrier protein
MAQTKEQIAGIFPEMVKRFLPEKAEGVNAVVQFDLAGDNGGMYWLRIAEGAISNGEGEADGAKLTIKANADDYFSVVSGASNAMQAYMAGKLKIGGDMGLAMKFMGMFANG